MCLLLIVSAVAQIWTVRSPGNPLDFRLFLFELCFFTAGSLAYRAYLWIGKHAWLRAYSIGSCLLIAVLTMLYGAIPAARLLYLVTVVFALPGIVYSGRWHRWDGFFGDLSHPLYLVHPLAMILILPAGNILSELDAIAGVLLVSLGLVHGVERPIERIRHSRVRLRLAPATA